MRNFPIVRLSVLGLTLCFLGCASPKGGWKVTTVDLNGVTNVWFPRAISFRSVQHTESGAKLVLTGSPSPASAQRQGLITDSERLKAQNSQFEISFDGMTFKNKVNAVPIADEAAFLQARDQHFNK